MDYTLLIVQKKTILINYLSSIWGNTDLGFLIIILNVRLIDNKSKECWRFSCNMHASVCGVCLVQLYECQPVSPSVT